MNFLDYDNTDNRVLGTLLQAQAAAVPDTVFLAFDDVRLTYKDVWLRASHYAAGLRAQGVEPGDRVCIQMNSNVDYVLLSFACNLLGAPWVPVNTDYRGDWLQQTLADSEPVLLLTEQPYVAALDNITLPDGCRVFVREATADYPDFQLLSQRDADFQPASVNYGDVSAIMWTSGTTGRSKGVMQSHNVWVRAALSSAWMFRFRAGDCVYNCLPLYNSAAWTANIYPALVAGVSVAIDPAFSASSFWDRIRYYRATQVFTLGAMHMFLWNAPPSPEDRNNTLRSAVMTPMPGDVHRPFCERFGLEGIHQGFGQSEVMVILRRPDDGVTELTPNSLGQPVDDVEVTLLDDNDQPVPRGDIGEFCVRPKSAHVLFNGYFKDPDATELAWSGGWYHTGDLGFHDVNGDYFFADRKRDLIRYKGRSVSSLAVESVARKHPAIADAAAFGIESAELSSEHEIMLGLVLKSGSTVSEEEIARFINANAPYFFVPRYIEFMDAFPMTPTQKVRKVELRERGLSASTWDAKAVGFRVER